MCDINQKTKLKTVVVYKAVNKVNGNYYSYFAFKKLSIGKVRKLNKRDVKTAEQHMGVWSNAEVYLNKKAHLFNKNMVGRVSGFKSKEPAFLLCTDNGPIKEVVLKITLGGSIMRGTSANIWGVPSTHTTYAGTEILSMEEV